MGFLCARRNGYSVLGVANFSKGFFVRDADEKKDGYPDKTREGEVRLG